MGKQYDKNQAGKLPAYPAPKDGQIWICGKNAVMEKLKAGNSVSKVLFQKNHRHDEMEEMVRQQCIAFEYVAKEELDRYTREKHQGVIALAPPYATVTPEELLERAAKQGESPFLLLLDEITDPHNLGAILRTAHQAGCHGVIVPERRSAPLTEVVAKTSAGAIEHIPVARVVNLNQTIDRLKKAGLWIAGADMAGISMYQADFKGPLGIVIGSEGEGISRLTAEKCDFMVSIPMFGQVDSLNASVSAAILVYEAVRQRKFS